MPTLDDFISSLYQPQAPAPVAERGFPQQPRPQGGTPMAELLNSPALYLGLGLLSSGARRPETAPDPLAANMANMIGHYQQQRAAQQQMAARQTEQQQRAEAFEFEKQGRAAQMEQRQRQAEQETAMRQAVQQYLLQNPSAAPGDITRQLLALTGDPSLLRNMPQPESPKQPTPPYTLTVPMPGNREQVMQYNPETRQHDIPIGAPRAMFAPSREPSARLPAPREIVDVPLSDGRIQKFRFNPQTRDYDIPIGAPFSRSMDALSQLLGQVPVPPSAGPSATVQAPAQAAPVPGMVPGAAPQSAAPPAVPSAAPGKSSAMQVRRPGAQRAQPPAVTTKAEYDALPSGALYVEDGKTYRKP